MLAPIRQQIGMVRSSPRSAGRVGNRCPGVDAPCSKRPHGRAHQWPLAPKKTGRTCHIYMDAFWPWIFLIEHILNGHNRRKPSAPSRDLFKRIPICRGVVGINLSNMAGARAMRQRQRCHSFGQ
jgi:hypothetical protein